MAKMCHFFQSSDISTDSDLEIRVLKYINLLKNTAFISKFSKIL